MLPGDVLLGKFQVERVLGRGGMGLVIAARHVELDELFAMKVMLPEMLEDAEAMERFVREARAAVRLKGEHVARVHDVGKLENGSPYILMEHLAGDDLSSLLEKRGALPLHEAAQYVLQACEAIAEAHLHNIVHRDLKPANLFLTARANGTPCIKVLDFGISKNIDPVKKFGPTLTVTGMFMGSPAFMSPEQMLNGKTVDTRCDIWALGAILYELTTGALPFVGATMPELVAKVMNETPPPPSALRSDLVASFDKVVFTCLQKVPGMRYQTVEDLMVALQPFAENKRQQIVKPVSAGATPADQQDQNELNLAPTVKPPKIEEPPKVAAQQAVETTTRKVKPKSELIEQDSRDALLPMDAEPLVARANAIEIAATDHKPFPPPDVDSSADELAMKRLTSRSHKFLYLGMASLGAVGTLIAATMFDSKENPAEVDAPSNISIKLVEPENVARSNGEALPSPSSLGGQAQPMASSSANSMGANTSLPTANPRSPVSSRSNPLSSPPTRNVKPTLY